MIRNVRDPISIIKPILSESCKTDTKSFRLHRAKDPRMMGSFISPVPVLALLLLAMFTPTSGEHTIYVGGFPYASQHNGEFRRETTKYNNRPVYKSGYWTIYWRSSGYAANKWVLDFDSIDELWDGTVAWSKENAAEPYLVAWEKDGAVSRTASLHVRGAPDRNGEYNFTNQHYNGLPVFERQGWHIYRRLDGFWYHDSNAISEDYDGSVDYSRTKSIEPFAIEWNTGGYSRYDRVHVRGSSYYSRTNGAYKISSSYKGFPLYKKGSWSIYRRNGGWVLDSNAADDMWSGTIDYTLSTANEPVATQWKSGGFSRFKVIDVSAFDGSNTTTGLYTISSSYDGFPVYESDEYSIYRRTVNNTWVLDVDKRDEVWSRGVIDYALSKVNDPTQSDWLMGSYKPSS